MPPPHRSLPPSAKSRGGMAIPSFASIVHLCFSSMPAGRLPFHGLPASLNNISWISFWLMSSGKPCDSGPADCRMQRQLVSFEPAIRRHLAQRRAGPAFRGSHRLEVAGHGASSDAARPSESMPLIVVATGRLIAYRNISSALPGLS